MRNLFSLIGGLASLMAVGIAGAEAPAASAGATAACALVGPCGDVNGTGSITSSDALTVLKAAVGQEVETVCEVTGSFEPGQLPRTGDETDYGPGSDGVTKAGTPRTFTDNGDGTITDHATGLMWEKKDLSGGVHDHERYQWTWSKDSQSLSDGTVFTGFLKFLNDNAFAGYTDWRLPNVSELLSLRNYGSGSGIFPIFDNHDCSFECHVEECNCKATGYHWTSTQAPSQQAMVVSATADSYSPATAIPKTSAARVRAVRGGL